MGEKRNVYRILEGKPLVKRPLGRLRSKWEDTVEDLVKTVNVFDKSISGRKADLTFQNALCKERMRKFCVFRDGMYLSRLVLLTAVFVCVSTAVVCKT
jgi:hypothetical protein